MPAETVSPEAPVVSTPVNDTAPVATPDSPVRGNPAADDSRRQLYEQYYGATSSEEVAPAGTASQPPASTSPAQGDSIPEGTSSAPAAPPLPPEYLEVLRAVQNELAAVKQQLKPVAPTVDTSAEPEPSWIALLREGRVTEAEDALANSIAKRAQQPIVDQAVARTREVMGAQAE